MQRPSRVAKALANNVLFGIESSDDDHDDANEFVEEAIDDLCDFVEGDLIDK